MALTVSGAEAEVLHEITRDEDHIVGDLKNLVRVPSVVGQEGPCQELVRQKLIDVGMRVTQFEPARDELVV